MAIGFDRPSSCQPITQDPVKGLGRQVEGSLLAFTGCEPADKHAVEMTVARLGRALGPPRP
jgi:hypothetical protein